LLAWQKETGFSAQLRFFSFFRVLVSLLF